MSAPCLAEPEPLALVETMRLWRRRFRFADWHRARLAASAEVLGLPFDPSRWAAALREAAARGPCGAALVRVALDADGRIGWTARPLAPLARPVRLALVAADTSDPLLRHKTTRRGLYDAALVQAQARGAADALLVNARGHVTETTRMNVFYRQGGRWHTPPPSDGLLPGVLRAVLVTRGRVAERPLHVDDLARVEALCVGNSARGMLSARLLG